MADYTSTDLGYTLSNLFQAPFTASNNVTLTGLQSGGTSLQYVSYVASPSTRLASCGFQIAGADISTLVSPLTGEYLYTTPGPYTFTVPTGVTSVYILCIGGGGAGSSATANIASTAGGDSKVVNGATTICSAGGGKNYS